MLDRARPAAARQALSALALAALGRGRGWGRRGEARCGSVGPAGRQGWASRGEGVLGLAR
ncbi:hypothetical protein SAMN05444161_0017 [Rhizobiales bacterium GAS191]|nr:hypothetical protein SAMN05444161_0017 [Rhizobiales bacterium GAS191]